MGRRKLTKEEQEVSKFKHSEQYYLNIIKRMALDIIACGGLDFIDIGKSNCNLKEDVDNLIKYYLKNGNNLIYDNKEE